MVDDVYKYKNSSNWPIQSFDAKDWAEAFCKKNPGVNQDIMLAWFTNALMRGYDEKALQIEKASNINATEQTNELPAIGSIWTNKYGNLFVVKGFQELLPSKELYVKYSQIIKSRIEEAEWSYLLLNWKKYLKETTLTEVSSELIPENKSIPDNIADKPKSFSNTYDTMKAQQAENLSSINTDEQTNELPAIGSIWVNKVGDIFVVKGIEKLTSYKKLYVKYSFIIKNRIDEAEWFYLLSYWKNNKKEITLPKLGSEWISEDEKIVVTHINSDTAYLNMIHKNNIICTSDKEHGISLYSVSMRK